MSTKYAWDFPTKGRIKYKRYLEAKDRMRERFQESDKTRLDYIIKIVSDVFNISIENIKSRCRVRKFTIARQTFVYFASKEDLTQCDVALYIGYTQHSNVKYCVKTVKGTLMKDKQYCIKLEKIKNILLNEESDDEKIESLKELDKHF